MRINTNISALIANSHLRANDNLMSETMERLSSGLKLNRSADDSAGMAIASRMRTQIRGLDQANENASDGESLVQSAEGALNEVTAMIQRMRELAVQGANGTNGDDEREAITQEITALQDEIERIAKDTEFNGKPLLDGSQERRRYNNVTGTDVVALSEQVPAGNYAITVTKLGTQAVKEVEVAQNDEYVIQESGVIRINGYEVRVNEGDTVADVKVKLVDAGDKLNLTTEFEDAAGGAASTLTFTSYEYGQAISIETSASTNELCEVFGFMPEAVTTLTFAGNDADKITKSGVITINGQDVVINPIKVQDDPNTADIDETVENTVGDMKKMLVEAANSAGLSASIDSGAVVFTAYSNGGSIDIQTDTVSAAWFTTAEFTKEDVTESGTDMKAELIRESQVATSEFSNTAVVTFEGNKAIIRDNGGFEMEYKLYPDEMKQEDIDKIATADGLSITTEVKDLGMMTLHIGAREGQIMDVNIPEISLEALGIDMINTNTEFGCGKAITALDGALDFVSALRSSLGAYQNRLDSTISNLSVVEENMTSAISRIEDADMAAEMTEFTKLQVLTQASTAMVAQANERPQTVLQLLQ